jgi:ABC-type nitrate/sulfonate/bicarbonate transport system permease component
MAMKTRLNDWFTPSLWIHLIAEARTLLLFALFATVGAGFVGGGGAGWYLMQQMDLLEYGKLFQGILLLAGLALILDLTLGIIEYRAGFGTTSTRKM